MNKLTVPPLTAALAAALLLAASLTAAAQEAIGEIVYLEDRVEIVRNGEGLFPDEIDIGTEVENFDLIQTDGTGFAEVLVAGPHSPGFTVKIAPDTAFYLELSRTGKNRQASLGMISGSISLKVQKIAGNDMVEVKTESATMGVRGTAFDVTSSPAGDILITCEEGRVACVDDRGRELLAEPGRAVEKQPGEIFRAVPVRVSDLAAFRRQWFADRLEVFKANALRAVKAYALRYLRLKAEFQNSYRELLAEQAILNKWIAEDRGNTLGGRMEIMREKKAIIGKLLQIRKILFIFERIYFRLAELETYYRQGYGRGLIRPGLSSGEFFERFAAEKVELGRQMAKVRYVVKLYARRNEGSFPLGGFGTTGPDDALQPADDFDQEADDFLSDDDDFSF
jgi:hypothetical protein